MYGKHKKKDSSVDATDTNDSFDENDLNQIGYRADWAMSEKNTFEFHGDLYKGQVEQRQPLLTFLA